MIFLNARSINDPDCVYRFPYSYKQQNKYVSEADKVPRRMSVKTD